MLRFRITLAVCIVVLSAIAWFLPRLRRDLLQDIITWDAPASDPAPLPGGNGPGLAQVARTRVVLIDGLTEEVAKKLPAWSAFCRRGVTLRVDVGFPSVSLPVEVALWTGLTQQQTGVVFRDRRPIVPPLANSIPTQVKSVAVAEYHGWIVRSLGFKSVEPPADPQAASRDVNPDAWKLQWEAHALAAVTSDATLAFVHILRVDSAGHKTGLSPHYIEVATEADAILAKLLAADPHARWFVLSDHGHVAVGGHGGEEPSVRQVQSCIAGPGITPGTRGALVTWGVRKWWLAPWWFVVACASLVLIRGEPTLSTRMVYAPEGRDMWLVWLPALALAVATTILGLRKTTIARVLVAQLAIPLAAAAAVITACGAWRAVFGAHVAPIVPRYTAYLSPLLLMVALGAAAVALAGLATLVRPRSDRSSPPEPPSSEPADAS